MSKFINKRPIEQFSRTFLPDSFTKDEEHSYLYWQEKNDLNHYRKLNTFEIEILVRNNNSAEDWNSILVKNNFNANLVKNCEFYGIVAIGALENCFLEFHDLKLPIGLYNSTIISCDIGDNVVIKNVRYLSHYQISNNCILFNIDEMCSTNHAKFGNGILKYGESESDRIWLEVANENGGRSILPFEEMIPADAYLWAKFRADKELMIAFQKITENGFNKRRGYYGTVGEHTLIKSCRIIKDVKIGSFAYIKGANKLKNTTILSSKEEPSQIGEGVELVNGIMGYGSKVFYGAVAIRFILGRNCQLKYGARLLNSVLGDNSTISCCELLNNIIFPFHEQHHNTSFTISTIIKGQSNIAAGATIGSNHNSRSPDGEIVAGRGFWPGLCTNFKHNCIFSSFILIAKGNYSYEMNIRYPFALVCKSKSDERIEIMPAYWFLYNMYAIVRNNFKYKKRDRRKVIIQNIEENILAPDTVGEIVEAIDELYYLAGLKSMKANMSAKESRENLIEAGREYLQVNRNKGVTLLDQKAMKRYGATIIKPCESIEIYRKMALYYAVSTILEFHNNYINSIDDLLNRTTSLYITHLYKEWSNLGGQLIPTEKVEELKRMIKEGSLSSWQDIHNYYNNCWQEYPLQKARYGLYIIEKLTGRQIPELSREEWKELLIEAVKTSSFIYDNAYNSRLKDYSDPYRKMVYDNDEEMAAVLGDINDNSFLHDLKESSKIFSDRIKKLL